MGDTVASYAARTVMEEEIERDPRTLKVIYDFEKKIRNGSIPSQLMEELGQSFYGDTGDRTAMYCACRLVGEIITGNLWRTALAIGSPPHADKEIAANNAVLANLPFGWKAKFTGGYSDSDGFVEWTLPVTGGVMRSKSMDLVTFENGFAPLEVGYTEYWTTLFHLLTEGIVARWPYHHSRLVIYKSMRDRFSPGDKLR